MEGLSRLFSWVKEKLNPESPAGPLTPSDKGVAGTAKRFFLEPATGNSGAAPSRIPLERLNRGKDKEILVQSNIPEHERTEVFIVARDSFLSQRKRAVEKEVQFTKKLHEELRWNMGETNLATDIEEVGSVKSGKVVYKSPIAKLGSLDDALQKPMPWKQRISYCKQFLNGMEFLHRHDCVHCDVKPDNCLLYERETGDKGDKGGILRIADLGKGAAVKGEEPLVGYEGNMRFGPPENAKSKSGDVYGTGLCLIRMLEEDFLPRDGTPLVTVKDKKPLAADPKRRGVERFILENPAFKRAHETSKTGFRGFVAGLQGRLLQKIGLSNAELRAEKEALDGYIGELCHAIEKRYPEVDSQKLHALLQIMTSPDRKTRPPVGWAVQEFHEIFPESQKLS